jgi:hypothetical protein
VAKDAVVEPEVRRAGPGTCVVSWGRAGAHVRRRGLAAPENQGGGADFTGRAGEVEVIVKSERRRRGARRPRVLPLPTAVPEPSSSPSNAGQTRWPSVSRLALPRVVVLGAAGGLSALVTLPSWSSLYDSGYGQLLLVKTGLVPLLARLIARCTLPVLDNEASAPIPGGTGAILEDLSSHLPRESPR